MTKPKPPKKKAVENNLTEPARPYGFQKGLSGNPGGRPKGWAEVKAAAQTHTADAIKTLAKIMKGGKKIAAATQVRAAEVLLERGWGRAAQTINVRQIASVTDMTDEEIAAVLAESARGDQATHH